MAAETLTLDAQSIRPEDLSTGTLMRELGLQRRPAWVLRKLMNVLEQRRQAKGLGWSRSWNKVGLNVFRTHVQRIDQDTDYFQALHPFLDRFLPKAPVEFREFVRDLLGDPSRMAFTFYHNHECGEDQYEGMTLSIGRRVPADATKRDRFDLILEDRRLDGFVDGNVDRIRIYICPWYRYRKDKEYYSDSITELSGDDLAVAQDIFQLCVRKYHEWKEIKDRQWSHWSQHYIDYFGPRSFIPMGTSFS
ncbi:MAG: hypothetical protein O2960_13030 [Verrucomicrobia bacterium]|nr:hypothetical protein [Verrucomicrobiota bacterium]